MEKRFSLQGKTAEGRPLIHLVDPGSRHGLGDMGGLEKTASGEHLPEVLELIESLEAQSDRLYLVNSALGAGEYVGFNLRGDWFTEAGLLHEPPGWANIPVWDIEARRRAAAQLESRPGWGRMAWGYPTFYNAHRFRHHANKDPNRAYGFILGAFWDPRMHRVILVSELERKRCANLGALGIYQRIQNGEFPDTSMGAKVPYDRCSICNHLAKSPRTYCEHVRKHATPPHGMRRILPDGRMCGVYNDYPRFFDDSFVFIGAERSAKVMANVTDQVGKGSHAYTSRVFSPGAVMGKVAGLADSPMSPREEEELDLGEALQRASTPPRGPSAHDIGNKISRVLSMVPVAGKQEKAALRFVADEERRKAGVRDGTATGTELKLWADREAHRLMGEGVGLEQIDRARALVHHHMQHAFGDKLGAAAKWAAHLKEIPAPDQHQVALLKDHEGRLTEVLPRPVLEQVAEDLPAGLSGLAELGVVLRPAEYQFCMLHALGDDGLPAHAMLEKRIIFKAAPVDPRHRPRWAPTKVPSGMLQSLRSQLGPALAGRSLRPGAVHARMRTPPPLAPRAPLSTREDQTLNKIAQLYNDYRIGLLAHVPGQGYESSEAGFVTMRNVPKTAQASELISKYLLRLAYWPVHQIG